MALRMLVRPMEGRIAWEVLVHTTATQPQDKAASLLPPEEPPVVFEPLRIEYHFRKIPPVEPMAELELGSIAQATTRAGGTLDNMPRDILKITRASPKVRSQTRAKAVVAKENQASAPAPAPCTCHKQFETKLLFTCGGAVSHQTVHANHGNVYRDKTFLTVRDSSLVTSLLTLERIKGITTRSGVSYQGPPIPTSSVVKPIPEVTKDQVHPSCSQSTAPVQPPVGMDECLACSRSLEVLVSLILIASGNSTPYYDPLLYFFSYPILHLGIVIPAYRRKRLFPWFGSLADDSGIVQHIIHSTIDLEGDILLLEEEIIDQYQPGFVPTRILMERTMTSSPTSRSVNSKNPMYPPTQRRFEKLLEAGLIYPISDSPWVSPVHCVPKKGGMTVVVNEENELIPSHVWLSRDGGCALTMCVK
ncbi:hypothetical protein Tco_0641341 [Tanacetum coccineum]